MTLPHPPPWTNPRVHLESLAAAVTQRLEQWATEGFVGRFYRKDPGLWPAAPREEVPRRLGWLDLPATMPDRVESITDFSDEVREDGFRRVLLLGMGGSSLAAQTFAATLGHHPAYPELRVLDSTHPSAVRASAEGVPLEKVFFLVASKSGTTLEPNSFFQYFWKEVAAVSEDPGQQFAAITDPGSSLADLAERHGFRQTFLANPDVGGRYSALTEFGLVPAALTGAPIRKILERTHRKASAWGPDHAHGEASPFRLGAELGEIARAGRDKVVFLTSPALGAFPAWGEQLLAESTGKIGRGLIPVAGEVDPFAEFGAHDVQFAYLALAGEEAEATDAALADAEGRGTPASASTLADRLDLGAEFFRWEIAVAAAGSVLGIDPFDQPDVEFAKELARQAMATPADQAPPAPIARVRTDDPVPLGAAVAAWIDSAKEPEYVALQAYLAPGPDVDTALRAVRNALRARSRRTTTLGYGPRFLHSTGQLHKGGPNTGLFLQIVDEPTADALVPPGPMTFRRILRAQADGDASALVKKGRRVLGVDVGADALAGLRSLAQVVRPGVR